MFSLLNFCNNSPAKYDLYKISYITRIVNQNISKVICTHYNLPLIEIKSKPNILLVTATMYHPVYGQCDSTPLLTASGLTINPYTVSSYNYIAISRDLHSRYDGKFNFYDTVYIPLDTINHKSNKKYIIVDLMNERWKKRIDFLESLNTPIYKYEDVVLAYK
jgi:hypothetical protein